MSLIEINLPKSISKELNLRFNSQKRQQIKVLKNLLKKAKHTEFGQQYHFDEVLNNRHPGKRFQELVPVGKTITFRGVNFVAVLASGLTSDITSSSILVDSQEAADYTM